MDVADFSAATFTGYAWFTSAKFHAKALFGSVTFTGPASFESATFNEDALFESVTFTHAAVFDSAAFTHAALFDSTTFNEGALFDSVTFTHAATFESATFNCPATFESATFTGPATFRAAQFNDVAVFESASFSRAVSFSLAEFNSGVSFESVTTSTVADFSSATFNSYGWFQSATFNNSASFQDAVFEELAQMGPLACTGTLDLSFAKFKAPVTIEAAAQSVVCYRTHWSSTASLRLRHARVDFTDAIFESPFSVVAHPRPFTLPNRELMGEAILAGLPAVQVLSLQGVDAAHLVLTDLDLSQCRFTGIVHLDQVRLEGHIGFAQVPDGVHRRGWHPIRFTRRRTLAEEQYWRAARPGAASDWATAPHGVDLVGPTALAALYRSLRKALEDGKDDPGAGDFYYGEMEMRRADRGRPWAERSLLAVYWALSGYGLRASRSLAWLVLAMTATVVVMMLWGLPKGDSATRGAPMGDTRAITAEAPEPRNPTGSLQSRLTTQRFEKSLRVVVNSVVFRSSGQNLTTAGTYTEMASRISEPVLLGLAVLAVRGRIKR